MEIINNYISHSINLKKYFNTDNVCFLDIETTGFSRSKNIIYLIGILEFESSTGKWKLSQFFANDFHKEKSLLKEFISFISSFDRIITYNGDAFDLPFIESRLNHHNIDYRFDKEKSFDIYRIIRRNKQFLDLPDLKLKTIEKSLGFYREDKYSGGDCIKFYLDYIKSGDKNLKDIVLKHNYDDLGHMLDIISILDVVDNKKSIGLGPNKDNRFTIKKLEIAGDMLNIQGSISKELSRNIMHYGNSLTIVSEGLRAINISIELKKGYISKDEKCFFIDTSQVEFLSGLADLTEYRLPENILVLMIEGAYVLDNIKNLLEKVLENVII